MEASNADHLARIAPDTTSPPYICDARFELALGSTQPSPPLSPSRTAKSVELKMASSAGVPIDSTGETPDLNVEGFSSRDLEAVKTLLYLSASDSPIRLGNKATVKTPALEKEKTQDNTTPPTPPATPAEETLANRDAASWKKEWFEKQHEALHLLICNPSGIYSQIPIRAGYNPLALSKIPIHHPTNGAEHPSFAWAMIMILSIIPGHEMYTNNLVRTILALWPNITKQETAELKLEKGKRTLSAQVTKSTPVIQNVKSGVDDLIDGKQYRLVRLVRLGEVVIMGPSSKTLVKEMTEESATMGPLTTQDDSTPAKAPGKKEINGSVIVSKKRAAEDDISTLPKLHKIEAGPSERQTRAFAGGAAKETEKANVKTRATVEARLAKRFKGEARRTKTMRDVMSVIGYPKLDEGAALRAPMFAKNVREAKQVGWITANAGFVKSNVSV